NGSEQKRHLLDAPRRVAKSGDLEWSGKRESNPRPSAWEADALPTELFPPTDRASHRTLLGSAGAVKTDLDLVRLGGARVLVARARHLDRVVALAHRHGDERLLSLAANRVGGADHVGPLAVDHPEPELQVHAAHR